MARMKFLCDADRCIDCNACVTACKNENEVPWGINRRRVVTINDGIPGERSVSMACMHCTDAPCAAVCPVKCIFSTEDGVQFYSAAPLNCPAPGLDGQHYGAHAGLALEPQAFPDSPNRRHFTDCVLWPEDEYQHVSEFRFA